MPSLALIVSPTFSPVLAIGQKRSSYLFVTEWCGETAGITYEVGIAVDPSDENIYR